MKAWNQVRIVRAIRNHAVGDVVAYSSTTACELVAAGYAVWEHPDPATLVASSGVRVRILGAVHGHNVGDVVKLSKGVGESLIARGVAVEEPRTK